MLLADVGCVDRVDGVLVGRHLRELVELGVRLLGVGASGAEHPVVQLVHPVLRGYYQQVLVHESGLALRKY